MDKSETRVDTIECQTSTVVSQYQRRRRYLSMILIKSALGTLSSRVFLHFKGGEETLLPTSKETESVPEFLTSLRFSDLFLLPGESVEMNPEIFASVSQGNKECLDKLKSYGTTHMACLKSDGGDSVLHLVAAWGHLELVKTIVSECPCLLFEPNSKDQLPLHVAAHSGHLNVVEALVETITFVSAKLCEEDKERLNPYVVKDIDGHTPLHTALQAALQGRSFNGLHMESALCLVNVDQLAAFLANKDNISPLYLAVEAGEVSLVKAMLKTIESDAALERKHPTLDFELEGRKFLVHAALKAKSTDILDIILKEDPNLVDERDEEGRTCLSFGAYIGYYEGICNLLDRSTKCVYVRDDDGSFPIHVAAEKGHIKIVKEILNRCSDSKYLLNKQGQNCLHIAANTGKLSVVFHLRSCYKTKYMTDEQDVNGNTPLHLAAIKWRHRIIMLLIGISKEKCMYIRNKCGLTPLDIVESNLQLDYIFHERIALLVMVFCYALRDRTLQNKKLTRPSRPLDRETNKDYINALIVVATLVATVTFAAGFTIPGGFNSSAPDLGRAILASDSALSVFVVFNTLGMQSSIISISALVWAQLGDPSIVHRSLVVAFPLLVFALLCMPLSFCFGMLTIVGHITKLNYFLRFSFMFFSFVMLFIFGPHVVLRIPGVSPAFGIYFIRFLLFSEAGDEVDQTSPDGRDETKKTSQKSRNRPRNPNGQKDWLPLS